MWRITWKGMWSHKRRLLGTTMAVLLGVAFLTTSLAIGSTMTAGFDDLFSEANAGTDVVVRNATVIGSGDGLTRGNLDAELADRIDAIDGVASAVSIIEGSGRIVASDGTPIGGGGPPTTAANWAGDSPVNPWQLAEGRTPSDVAAGQPYEVVIDRASATTGNLQVGDETVVQMPQPVDVTIVGLATFGGADSSGPTTYTAFTERAAAELVGRPGEVSAIRIAADDGVSQDELRDVIADALPDNAEALTGAELTDEMMAEIEGEFLGMFKAILLAFAVIALVVASFSIHNTFSILIAQRSRESALLRALGASRRQVLRSVVGEAIVIGAIASLAGIAVGYGLAVGLKTIMDSAGFDLGFDGVVMASSTIVIALVVGIGSTVLASFVPALRASRVSPLAALRDSAVDSTGASKGRLIGGVIVTALGIATVITATTADQALVRAGLGALLTLVGAVVLGPVVARPGASVLGYVPSLLRGQSGRLARRNAMRDPRRTAGSAAALMIGTAVVALFTTFGASIKASVEEMVNQDFGGDLVIVSDDFSGAGLSPVVAEEVAELPEVAVSAGMAIGMITADGNEIDPAVIDPAEFGALMDLGVSEGSFDDGHCRPRGGQRTVCRGPRPRDRQRARCLVRRRCLDRVGDRRHLRHDAERRRHDHHAGRLDTARRSTRSCGGARRSGRRCVRIPGPRCGRHRDGTERRPGRPDPIGVRRQPRLRDRPDAVLRVRHARPRRADRADGHRQHVVAVDPRAHQGTRLAPGGRSDSRRGPFDGPLGVGDRLDLRHAGRHRPRGVPRLGFDASTGRPGGVRSLRRPDRFPRHRPGPRRTGRSRRSVAAVPTRRPPRHPVGHRDRLNPTD